MSEHFVKQKLNREDHATIDRIARTIGPVFRVIIFPFMLIRKIYKWTYERLLAKTLGA